MIIAYPQNTNEHLTLTGCTPAKLIVCTVPQGLGVEIVIQLYEKSEIINIQHNTARTQHAHESNHDWQEIDVLQVVVKKELADEVFNLMYQLTNLHAQEGRFIYQMHLPRVTPFKLPLTRDLNDLPVEEVVSD